jgi:hypothetical protein
MINNIPTAEEMFDANQILPPGVTRQACIAFMKTFAKLHVEAALTEASKTTRWKEQITMQGLQVTIIKSSILNAYPLNNIK